MYAAYTDIIIVPGSYRKNIGKIYYGLTEGATCLSRFMILSLYEEF